MTTWDFSKGHGTENDFVVLPDADGVLDLDPELVRALCDRRRGLGADGLLRVVRTSAAGERVPGDDPPEWFMDHRNADGTTAEMCGNGVRVYARYLVAAGLAGPGTLRLGTRAGVREVSLGAMGDVTVDMGAPRLIAEGPVPVQVGGVAASGTAVSMGNPHLVVVAEAPVEDWDLTRPPVVPREVFPEGVNLEVVQRAGERHLRLRVHERGVGETRSCGTGVCAAAVAAQLAAAGAGGPARAGTPAWTVDVPGGRLRVELDGTTARMTGPAVLVASGTVDLDALRR